MAKQLPFRESSILQKQIAGGNRRVVSSNYNEARVLRDHVVQEEMRKSPRLAPVDTITDVNVTTSGVLSSSDGKGHTMVNGRRILVTGNVTQSQNGIYIYNSAGPWRSALDVIVSGSTIPVGRTALGTMSGTEWRCYTVDPVVIGTTAMVWKQCGSTLFWADGGHVGLGTVNPTASRLHIDGETETSGPTLRVENSSASATVLEVDGGSGGGKAFEVLAGVGRGITVTGGSNRLLHLARAIGAGATESIALLTNTNSADPTVVLEINQDGVGRGADILRTGIGGSGVEVVRIRNTNGSSNETALNVINATNNGGYAIRGYLSSASSTSPAILGLSDGIGEGGWFTNTLSGIALRSSKTGSSGNAAYMSIGTSGNASDAIYGTTVGTGRVALFERNNSTATLPVIKALQVHASSSGTAVEGVTSGVGSGGRFEIANGSNNVAALIGVTSGTGPAVESQGRLSTTGGLETTGNVPGIANDGTTNPGGVANIDAASTDMAGWITIGTGATPGTAGILATITYANPLLAAAKIILLTPRNAAAALEVQKVYVDMAGATTTTFDIRVGDRKSVV